MSIVENTDELRPIGPVSILGATKERCSQYECRVAIIPEAEGGFSIIATRLPGCASQGDTIDEAINNIKEAFQGVAEIYLKEDGEIPWEKEEDIPEGTKEFRWVLVNVEPSVR